MRKNKGEEEGLTRDRDSSHQQWPACLPARLSACLYTPFPPPPSFAATEVRGRKERIALVAKVGCLEFFLPPPPTLYYYVLLHVCGENELAEKRAVQKGKRGMRRRRRPRGLFSSETDEVP